MSYETPSLPMWEKRNCQVGQSTVWGVNTFWLERPQEFGQGFKKRKNSTPAKYLETHIIQLKSSLNGRGLKKVSSLVFIFSYGKLVLLCNFSIQFQMLCKQGGTGSLQVLHTTSFSGASVLVTLDICTRNAFEMGALDLPPDKQPNNHVKTVHK